MQAATQRPWLLRGTVLALAIVVGAVAWIVSGDGEQDGEATPVAAEARIVEAGQLADAAATLGHPVYWAGPIEGSELELTEAEDGSTQVRYLEDPGEAGAESSSVLTIGSYPLPDPAAALDAFAAEPGSVVKRAANGAEVLFSESNPSSVYFVAPDNSVQVEVYHPQPQRALDLALAGDVRPAS
jgi:hypothetical protein